MTTLPTFAECAAVPYYRKRTALEQFIALYGPNGIHTAPWRDQLTAVIEEERKERDALAAALEDTRKVRDEWCDEYTKARDERDALRAENEALRKALSIVRRLLNGPKIGSVEYSAVLHIDAALATTEKKP